MARKGWIWGTVVDVTDGDTLTLQVTSRSQHNEFDYRDVERIRFRDQDAPELNTDAGLRARGKLQRKLMGQRVRCVVHARDCYGRLVCEISEA